MTSLVCSSKPGSPRPARLGVIHRFHPLRSLVSRTHGSPKFPANPFGLCHALGPRRSLAPGHCSVRAWPLPSLGQRHPSDMTFEALSHSLSRRCLRFVPSSRTTTQNSLPVADRPFRVGFPIPTEFVWRVSHFRAPLSQGFSWREAILPMNLGSRVQGAIKVRGGLPMNRGSWAELLELLRTKDLRLIDIRAEKAFANQSSYPATHRQTSVRP